MEYFDGPSRSQKKRDSTQMQKIGEQLLRVPSDKLKKFNLPDGLLQALEDWKRFPGHEAKRRQMQFIGRLMRDADPDLLEKQLTDFFEPSRRETELLHQAEQLRDSLVQAAAEGELDAALTELESSYPSAPLKRIRHMAEAAAAERAAKKSPKTGRELYRALRELLLSATDLPQE